MKTVSSVVIATLLVLTGCARESTEEPEAKPGTAVADVVYTNVRIYTVNETQPWAEAVAIKDGRFLVVGSNDDANALVGEPTQTVDLRGRFVMPGIVDMHAHPFTGVDMGIGGINLSSPSDHGPISERPQLFAACQIVDFSVN